MLPFDGCKIVGEVVAGARVRKALAHTVVEYRLLHGSATIIFRKGEEEWKRERGGC